MMIASIIGGSGYAGGELVRLLLDHPEVTIQQVTSERNSGKFVRSVHPNLRKRSDLKFSSVADLQPVDVVFSALPHGVAMGQMAELRQKAPIVIDLSADFRLRDPADYPKWYGHDHQDPQLLGSFVYGIPELHRDELREADLISSAGCMAATSILGLYPLIQALTVDGQNPEVAFSATAIEAVRGILATSHVFLKDPLPEKEIWGIYRAAYKDEPFMRLVKEASGVHRYPEPKLLSGSNWCDVGFERDPYTNRVVVM